MEFRPSSLTNRSSRAQSAHSMRLDLPPRPAFTDKIEIPTHGMRFRSERRKALHSDLTRNDKSILSGKKNTIALPVYFLNVHKLQTLCLTRGG